MPRLVRPLLLAAAGFLVGGVLAAGPPAGEIMTLVEQYQQRLKAYTAAQPEGAAIDVQQHPATEFRPKFRALAEKYAGQPVALLALNWLIQNSDTPVDDAGLPDAQWALERLTRDHANRPEIRDTVRMLYYNSDRLSRSALEQFYQRVYETNPDRQAKAAALCYRAVLTLHKSGGDTDTKAREASRQEAIAQLKRVQQEFQGTDAATQAGGYLFEAEHLQVGMPAPDFAGPDADGKELRLSQYRGRVVVVDFWGHW